VRDHGCNGGGGAMAATEGGMAATEGWDYCCNRGACTATC
jgi:hypothetical protein